MFNTIVGAGAVGAGAGDTAPCGSGSASLFKIAHRKTTICFNVNPVCC
jgi:hypothetical protein